MSGWGEYSDQAGVGSEGGRTGIQTRNFKESNQTREDMIRYCGQSLKVDAGFNQVAQGFGGVYAVLPGVVVVAVAH